MAPSTVNVAALHFLKKRDAKSSAEFFKLEETRRMGESGQDVAAIGCSMASAQLVTVLSALNRAVSTDVAKVGATAATAEAPASIAIGVAASASAGASAGASASAAVVEVTGVAAPGATRRGAFDRFDILHARLIFALCSAAHWTITLPIWHTFCGAS